MTDPRRRIPPVDRLLAASALQPHLERWGRQRVTAALRDVQAELRRHLDGGGAAPDGIDQADWYAARVEERMREATRPALRRAINATGVVLHTNLGRAPLAAEARRAAEAAAGYATLEIDLETGARGSRHEHCVRLLRELTGAEAALVVNNNAAAVVLAVNTLAAGRAVVVSRGELVEIGGSFRVPEIIERSGARLVEVGATNRTHERDYEAAMGPDTAMVLRVHRSNFRVEGFTAEVEPARLAEIAHEAGIPFVNDLGSGLLVDLAELGIDGEPTARSALEQGADLVTMSGDKLLGGPQAGIVVGRTELVDQLRGNPLSRALRPDKLTLAALEATLTLWLDAERAREQIPVLAMIAADPAELRQRAERIARALGEAGVDARVVDDVSAVGGGALPGVELPTAVVAVDPGAAGADVIARRLRTGKATVVARVRDGTIRLDPRTIAPTEEPVLLDAVRLAFLGEGDG